MRSRSQRQQQGRKRGSETTGRTGSPSHGDTLAKGSLAWTCAVSHGNVPRRLPDNAPGCVWYCNDLCLLPPPPNTPEHNQCDNWDRNGYAVRSPIFHGGP